MACWGSPVSSSVNIKDEWALADIFVSDSNTHKALLNIVMVLLLCAGLTGAEASPQCTVWQHRRWARLARRGWPLVRIRLNPTYHGNTLLNNRLFGQSQRPGALGSSVRLPSLWLFVLFRGLFGHWTFSKTQADLIPSYFPLGTLPHKSQTFGLLRLEKEHRKVKQPAVAQHLDRRSNLIIFQVTP